MNMTYEYDISTSALLLMTCCIDPTPTSGPSGIEGFLHPSVPARLSHVDQRHL